MIGGRLESMLTSVRCSFLKWVILAMMVEVAKAGETEKEKGGVGGEASGEEAAAEVELHHVTG
ncbi:hypothetical protein V2J09_014985 [Rumex salicifolius]